MQKSPDDLLSTQDAARELGITPSRVCVLIRAGRLKAVRLGQRAFVIRRADLAAVKVRRPGRPKESKEE